MVKPINSMKLQFEGRSINEAFSRTAVAAFVAQTDPTVEELSDIKTAVSEAVTNCIVHGYRDRLGTVYITANLLPDNRVVIKIRDKGRGIPDIKQAMEPMYTSAPEEERAGLGFAVMQTLMDKVKVASKEGKGTTVTLERSIRSKGE